MGKKKKKGLLKQVNPEKSNKMIYAVGVGVLILFIIGVFFVLNEDKKRVKDPILNTSKVLIENDNIINAIIGKDNPNKMTVILKEKDKDTMKLIKAKATDLSSIKRKVEFEFIISVGKIENEAYLLKVKDGEISNFRSIKNIGKEASRQRGNE